MRVGEETEHEIGVRVGGPVLQLAGVGHEPPGVALQLQPFLDEVFFVSLAPVLGCLKVAESSAQDNLYKIRIAA